MALVKMFQTKDGSLFKAKSGAERRERLLDIIDQFFKAYRPRKATSIDFANGYGFVQYKYSTLNRLSEDAAKLFKRYSPKAFDEVKHDVRSKLLGRILCDNDSPLRDVWNFLQSIDFVKCQLWGQPYFATYAEKAVDGSQLNKKPL